MRGETIQKIFSRPKRRDVKIVGLLKHLFPAHVVEIVETQDRRKAAQAIDKLTSAVNGTSTSKLPDSWRYELMLWLLKISESRRN